MFSNNAPEYHEMLSSARSASGRVLKHAAMTNLTAITVGMPIMNEHYFKVNINLDTTGVSVLFV